MIGIKKWMRKLSLGVAGACLAIGCTIPAMPVPTAEALSLGDAIGIGAGIFQASAAKKQAKAQLDYVNDTEEGRQELLKMFKEKYGVNNDAELNNRVDVLMANLSRAVAQVDESINDKPYLYFVNNSEEINAFCTFGHVMSINMGILAAFPNDDELAVVVGHEMGHGQKNHTYKGALKSMDQQLLAGVAVAATGGTAVGQLVGTLALRQSLAHGTKSNEKEADDLSFTYITHSNYNPGATAAVWQRFLDLYGNNAQNALGSLFAPSDHPNNAARRDTYVKKLEAYSGGHVTAADGVVKVNGKTLLTPAATDNMSSAERSYFVLGNLAAAYHNGDAKSEAYVSNGTVMLGNQPIITPLEGDEPADVIAAWLNRLK